MIRRRLWNRSPSWSSGWPPSCTSRCRRRRRRWSRRSRTRRRRPGTDGPPGGPPERGGPGRAASPGPGLVGRETDFARLARAWQATRSGNGTAVLLEGEGGIGKTRLVEELQATACGPGPGVGPRGLSAIAAATAAGPGQVAPFALWTDALSELAATACCRPRMSPGPRPWPGSSRPPATASGTDGRLAACRRSPAGADPALRSRRAVPELGVPPGAPAAGVRGPASRRYREPRADRLRRPPAEPAAGAVRPHQAAHARAAGSGRGPRPSCAPAARWPLKSAVGPLADDATRVLIQDTARLPEPVSQPHHPSRRRQPASRRRDRPRRRERPSRSRLPLGPRRRRQDRHQQAVGPGAHIRRVHRRRRAAVSTRPRSLRSRCPTPARAVAEALGSGLFRTDDGRTGFRHALLAEAVYQEIPEAAARSAAWRSCATAPQARPADPGRASPPAGRRDRPPLQSAPGRASWPSPISSPPPTDARSVAAMARRTASSPRPADRARRSRDPGRAGRSQGVPRPAQRLRPGLRPGSRADRPAGLRGSDQRMAPARPVAARGCVPPT